MIEAGPTFLGLEEPEAGAALRPHLEADGITLMIGDPCIAVERQSAERSRQRSAVVVHLKSGAVVAADRLLVATGRRPNVEAWRATGLAQTERGWLKVDPATLEARAGVFGAGDVTGLGGFTHLAYYHGQVIARRLRGMDARADHTAVPRVTFTDPEIASVGLSEAAARAKGIDVVVASADPAETARGYIHDFHRGALKLVGDRAARGADRRDAGHSACGRDRRRARAGDQAGHSAEDARRRHPPVPGLQPGAWGEPRRARDESGAAQRGAALMPLDELKPDRAQGASVRRPVMMCTISKMIPMTNSTHAIWDATAATPLAPSTLAISPTTRNMSAWSSMYLLLTNQSECLFLKGRAAQTVPYFPDSG